eukprot:3285586-Rhodomonas_salina.2
MKSYVSSCLTDTVTVAEQQFQGTEVESCHAGLFTVAFSDGEGKRGRLLLYHEVLYGRALYWYYTVVVVP